MTAVTAPFGDEASISAYGFDRIVAAPWALERGPMLVQVRVGREPLTDRERHKVETEAVKLGRLLPRRDVDLALLAVALRRHAIERRAGSSHPHNRVRLEEATKPEEKPVIAQHETVLSLRLPAARLYAVGVGATLEGAVLWAFRLLIRQVVDYKATHFSGQSDYPRRASE